MIDEVKGMLVQAEKNAKGVNTGWLLKIDYKDFKEHGYKPELMWLENSDHSVKKPATVESVENTIRQEKQ